MKTNTQTVRAFLTQNQYVIPTYQRPYQWSDDLLEGLWSDIGEMYLKLNQRTHYLGSVLTDLETDPSAAIRGAKANFAKNVWSLVDGQQRFLTILLLLAACRDHFTAGVRTDIEKLLVAGATGEPRLVAQEEDRELVERILLNRNPAFTKEEQKSRVARSYTLFSERLSQGEKGFWLTGGGAKGGVALKGAALRDVILDRLIVTDLQLEPGKDQSAPAIFDAINGKRRELEPVDLLRNTIFAELDDIPLFTSSWAKLEAECRKISLPSARLGTLPLFIDSYLRSLGDGASQHLLARRLNELIAAQAPASLPSQKRKARTKAIMAELSTSFDEFKRVQASAFGGSHLTSNSAATRSLDNISMLSSGPPLPLALYLLRMRRKNKLTEAQLTRSVRTLESYLARRVIVGRGQQNMRSHLNAVVQKLVSEYGNASTIGSVKAPAGAKLPTLPSRLAALLSTAAESRPADDELEKAIKTREDFDKLKAQQKFAILRALNDQIAGTTIVGVNPKRSGATSIYSIEHVFPDSFKEAKLITGHWETQLTRWGVTSSGIDRLIELRNHLGNYSLVHNNSALGRRPFTDEGRMKGKVHTMLDRPLHINESVTKVNPARTSAQTKWTADEIISRADYLADVAVKAFPY